VTGDAIFSLYPFPNDPLGPYGKNTFTEQLPADGNGLRTSVKADNRIRDFDGWLRFWGNYTRDSSVLGSTGGALDSSIKPKIQNYGFGMILSIAGQDQSHAFRLSGAGTVVSLDPYLAQVLSPSSNLILNVTQPGAGTVNYVSATSPMGKQILNSIGLNGVTQTSPVTGPLGQVTIAGFSSVGADTFSYPQKRNDLTAQIAYTGVVSKLGKIYSFGAEWRPRRLDTRLVPAIRPLISFSGLQNVSSGAISISTPSGVVDTAKISSTTMVAMGSPSGVLQTLADVRPPRNGLIPINSATLNQGSFFFQIERQISPQLRTISGIRVEVADAHDNSLPTLESTFNRQQLLGDAQDAETNCGSRCNGLAAATAQAFPANFKKFTEGNRFSLGPRLGFAWAAQSGRPWSLRGGFGLYTGQLQFLAANDARQAFNAIVPLNYANFSINSSQGTYLFNLANPAVQQLSPGLAALRSGSLNALTTNPFQLITQGIFDLSSIALQPTLSSLTLIEPNKALKNPYSLQYSITAETESRGFTFSLSYVGTRGSRLLRLTTPSGGVNRGSVRLDNASVLGSGFPIFQGQLLPPLNQTLIAESFSLAPTQYESVATSLYNSIQFEVRRLYSHGLQFSSALTYSRSFDDASDAIDLLGAYALPQNNENNSEWGPSNFDMPVRFVSSLVWDIAPKQRRIAFRGWQASGIGSVQNGQPFTVNSTFDINEDGNLTDRLKTDTGLTNPPGADSRTLLRLPAGVTTATFVANAGQNGTVGRNSFRGFGIANLDLALSKTFEISESRQFRVRCEAFNAFNSPHFGIPQRLLEAPAFGEAVRTISPARILQLSLKFNF